MAPAGDKRHSGRKVAAVACFDSFGKVAMTLLAACRREGAETTLHLLQVSNRVSLAANAWRSAVPTAAPL